MEETFEPEPLDRRAAFISWRLIAAILALIVVVTVALVIAYRSRGSDVERGTRALVDAFSKRRSIEPRLSGGFKGGEFRPLVGDASGIESSEVERARGLITRAAAKGEPRSQLAYGRLLLLSDAEKLPEALKYLRRAVASEPDNAEAHNDLGVCLIQQGKLEDAMDEFEASLERKADMPEALFNHALSYQRLLLRDAASNEFSRLLEIEPDRTWLGEIKRRQQEVSAPLAPQKKQAEIVAALEAALAIGNIDDAKVMADHNYEITVRHAYYGWAPEHLRDAVAGNTEGAARALAKMEVIGNRFVETKGDTCIVDFASYLRNLPDAERENELKLINEYLEEEGLYASQKPDHAQAVFEELAKRFAGRGNDTFQYSSTFYSGVVLYLSGSFAMSIDVLRQAQAIVERHTWPYHRAPVLVQLAIAHSRLGRDSVAIKYCEQALQSGQHLWNSQAKALQYMSSAYGNLGDLDRRLASLRESTGIFLENVPRLKDIASNYLNIAELYRVRGNHRLALLYASESLRLSELAKDNSRAAQASSFTAVEYVRLNKLEPAEEFRKRAFDYLNKLETNGRAPSAQAAQYVLSRAAEMAEARGDHRGAVKLYSDAESVLEKAEDKTIPLIRVLRARAEASAEAGDSHKARLDLEHAVRLIEGYREKIAERENRSNFLDASQSVFDQMIALNIRAFNRGREAFNFSEQSRARTLLDEFVSQQNASSIRKQVKPFKLESVQKALPDSLRLLTYSVTNEGTFLFLITRTGIEIAESPATTETLDHLVEDYVSSLKDADHIEEVNQKARTLYDYLIAPVAERIRDGRTLCIAPDKALNVLPFAALVDHSGRYLIESCRLTYTPSASALALCIEESRAKRASKDESILAVGNPYFNRDEFPQLRDLPDAENEVKESAAGYLKEVILIGREATEDRVNEALKDCDVAHMAGHCLVQEKSPWLAALVLARPESGTAGYESGSDNGSPPGDGLLHLEEVYGMSLPRIRLVVLSACQSGLGKYYRGEGIVSLVRPFLAAGVPTVVASLWSVDSRATSALMIDFHRERRSNNSAAGEALRAAQIRMAHTDSYKHPYYWAPFIAVGSND